MRCVCRRDCRSGLVETANFQNKKGRVMTRKMIGWLLALALGGCASAGNDRKMPVPAPPVAPAPRYSPQALDSGLRAKAREELLAGANEDDPILRCNAIEGLSDVDP